MFISKRTLDALFEKLSSDEARIKDVQFNLKRLESDICTVDTRNGQDINALKAENASLREDFEALLHALNATLLTRPAKEPTREVIIHKS